MLGRLCIPATIKPCLGALQIKGNSFINNKLTHNGLTTLSYQYNNDFTLDIPFQDYFDRKFTCLLVMLYFKYDLATIQSRMALLSG
jgi:alanine racemase